VNPGFRSHAPGSEIKIDHRESFAKLPMVRVALVYDTRLFPSPGRRLAHHNAAAGGAHKIEGPCGVLFFRPVAEEWSISKADGEPADFGHDMERHQEVENDGKYAGPADERIGTTVTRHLDILIIKVVEKREVLFVAVADVCIHERVVQVEFGLGYLGGLFFIHSLSGSSFRIHTSNLSAASLPNITNISITARRTASSCYISRTREFSSRSNTSSFMMKIAEIVFLSTFLSYSVRDPALARLSYSA
jgi:hypothetical protein